MTHGKEALGSKLFASVGRPTKTYIQQLPTMQDLNGLMSDSEKE